MDHSTHFTKHIFSGWNNPIETMTWDNATWANKCYNDNATAWSQHDQPEQCMEELWQVRMREIQGAICIASIFQLVLGYAGLIGLFLKYITPLTIAPAVSMIGISLYGPAGDYAGKHWGISIL